MPNNNKSKLDYLNSKYTSKEEDNNNISKKKKRKNKKKSKDAADTMMMIQDLDADYSWANTTNNNTNNNTTNNSSQTVKHTQDDEERHNDSDNNSDDNSDGPVVVDNTELIAAAAAGKVMTYNNNNNNNNNSRNDDGGDDHEITSRQRQRRRYDSDDDYSDAAADISNMKDTITAPRRRRYDSDDDDESRNNDGIIRKRSKMMMSSGHSAGLQNATQFSRAEMRLQKKKKDELAKMSKEQSGFGSQTIYRDKSGKVLDVVSEFQNHQDLKEKKAALETLEKEARNKGAAQKREEEDIRKEWEKIQQSAFARSIQDDALEQMKKNEIREGDPMAFQAIKREEKKKAASGKPTKPVYKGPPPKPNRFCIKPGYRWDGVDRGNGFEDLVLADIHGAKHKKEAGYRYSVADM